MAVGGFGNGVAEMGRRAACLCRLVWVDPKCFHCEGCKRNKIYSAPQEYQNELSAVARQTSVSGLYVQWNSEFSVLGIGVCLYGVEVMQPCRRNKTCVGRVSGV